MPSVFNPTKVQWTLSPDHTATLFDGSPALTSYRLEIVGIGAPPPQDLGKPAIGQASLPPRTAFAGNGPFIARIVAIGPGGESPSGGSDPFGFANAPAAPTDVVTVP